MAGAAACGPTEPTRADPPSEPPLRFPPRPLRPLPRARPSLAGAGAGRRDSPGRRGPRLAGGALVGAALG